MHILLLTKNHCSYFLVTISGSFLTHFSLYARRLVAHSFSWLQLAPTAASRWGLFILSFYKYGSRSSERLSNLSEATQQSGAWGSDIRVHALKHPSILFHPWKHNIEKLICKCIFCDLKGRFFFFFFLMGKSKDDSWLIGAEDLVTFPADLAQVRSES